MTDLTARKDAHYADVAQQAAQLICNHRVAGSIPVISSKRGSSSTGRAPALQAGCCGFDARLSLQRGSYSGSTSDFDSDSDSSTLSPRASAGVTARCSISSFLFLAKTAAAQFSSFGSEFTTASRYASYRANGLRAMSAIYFTSFCVGGARRLKWSARSLVCADNSLVIANIIQIERYLKGG